MNKNESGQVVGTQVVDAATGGQFIGTVTVYVTGDNGTQAPGSVGAGLCTSEGNGYYTYAPSRAETNYDLSAFTFIGTGAVPTTVQEVITQFSRGEAGRVIGAQLVNASTGLAFGGAVTAYITGDGGTQAIGSVSAGICTAKGNGYYTYLPTATETDYELIAFTFSGTSAIPATVQVATVPVITSGSLSGYSANDVVTRALRLLGVIDATATPSAEDMQAGFDALNDMVDNWSTQRQTIYKITRNVFSLTAGTAVYTLGTGGTWNIARPAWIDRVSVIPTNSGSGNTGPLEIPIGFALSVQAFQQLQMKTATSSYPRAIYWDRDWSAGLSTVQVYPVPTSSTSAIVLYAPTAVTKFADFSTLYTFPPGYVKAIRYNLAVELAPEFGIEVPDGVRRIAVESLADIKRANFAPVEAHFDAALIGRSSRYNIYADGY